MLKTILLGLDGSPHCEACVDLALRWAKQFDCMLVALGIVDEPSIRGDATWEGRRVTAVFDHLVEDARHRIEGILEKFALRCSEEQVAFKLLEDVGYPDAQIFRESERYDLIMLGTQTYFHADTQTRPCKTLESVLRNAPRPVTAVPQAANDGEGILIAYDGSLQAARTLQAFVSSGLPPLGGVEVVYVGSEKSVAAAKVVDRAIDFLSFHDIPARPKKIVTLDPPGKALVAAAAKQNAGLLVMGAFGQPKIREFFVGSVTCTVLQSTQVPVFLYH
ncbi:MAG: universal stress protein [Planctomycetales bacterium]|nr:universal stress protein [Planctomycetales bacterium]NIM08742.1 universal stress protein [Planctomycetales bacterium]NIN08210.1 universal stress protein [Planctomycetales bacterium]NIN77338.1 universal stress protein [Planctomycetales bacterium]NIO34522.1 universal stress protein [Planctomycetales bacterium]